MRTRFVIGISHRGSEKISHGLGVFTGNTRIDQFLGVQSGNFPKFGNRSLGQRLAVGSHVLVVTKNAHIEPFGQMIELFGRSRESHKKLFSDILRRKFKL